MRKPYRISKNTNRELENELQGYVEVKLSSVNVRNENTG